MERHCACYLFSVCPELLSSGVWLGQTNGIIRKRSVETASDVDRVGCSR